MVSTLLGKDGYGAAAWAVKVAKARQLRNVFIVGILARKSGCGKCQGLVKSVI